MNKPLGLVCSHREPGRSIYELLPPRWQSRDPALSSIGRLDVDTSGLLLITDDGPFLHGIISPKARIAKRYFVTLARPLEGHEAEVFADGGLILESETTPLAPAWLDPITLTTARLTIVEGRYHQVRRMFAAIGNHVSALSRDRIGAFDLPADLGSGSWRRLSASERMLLFAVAEPLG
jgi:16S rRNA pseudouridine516 synthase